MEIHKTQPQKTNKSFWDFSRHILQGVAFKGCCCSIRYVITKPCLSPHLTGIARHFRFGNQEDAHEFLQYTVDAMQKACLNGSNK